MIETCDSTVSVLHALVFGSDGACIELGQWSLVAVIVVFGAAVTVLQFVVKKLLFGHRDPDPESRQPVSTRLEANMRRSRLGTTGFRANGP